MGTILVATDFSACSRTAVRLAVALARRERAPLFLLHAVQAPPVDLPAVPISVTGWEVELLTAAELELAGMASELRRSELAVETRAVLGSPSRLILETAQQLAADLIVLGTHGRKGAAHLFLGSVAEHVVRASQCPVLVTREGAAPAARWDGRQSLNLAIVADGTSASQAAFYWTRTAAQPVAGQVSLVRAYWPPHEAAHYGIQEAWPGEQGHPELLGLLERDLRRDARALAGAHDPPIRFRIASRDGAEGLSEDARAMGADALVMGVGRHPKVWSPIGAAAVLRAATVPVFCIPETIRPAGRRMVPVRSLLVACDLSDSSKQAIAPAYGLLTGGGRVELCYVNAPGRPDMLAGGPEVSALADDERAAIESQLRAAIPSEAAEHGIATHVSVIDAPFVDEAILAAAERLDVDVVALASHGRSGLPRALLGSVAEQVARRSPRPVLIIPQRGGSTGK